MSVISPNYDLEVSRYECQMIEGYIAHKWGYGESLPSDHPYKTGFPMPVIETCSYDGDWAYPAVLKETF